MLPGSVAEVLESETEFDEMLRAASKGKAAPYLDPLLAKKEAKGATEAKQSKVPSAEAAGAAANFNERAIDIEPRVSEQVRRILKDKGITQFTEIQR